MTTEPVVFRPPWTAGIGYLFLISVAAAGAGFFVCMARANGSWVAAAPLLLLAAGVFGAAVYGLTESFSVYRLDDQGITRQTPRGARCIRWADVADFHVDSSDTGGIRLRDTSGRTLWISLGAFSRQAQKEYRALVLQRLQPQHAQYDQGFAGAGRSFEPARGAAGALVIFGALACLCAFFPLLGRVQGSDEGIVAFVALFMSMSFLLWGLAIELNYRFLVVGADSVEDRKLFTMRRIRFSRMESVTSKTVSGKNSVYEVTRFGGEGQTIAFTEQMPDYQLLRDYSREHAAGPKAEKGPIPPVIREVIRSGRIAWCLLGVLAVALSTHLGYGVAATRDAMQRLARHQLMDAEWVTTEGSVTRRLLSPVGRHIVDFQFGADDRTYRGSSFVSADMYSQLRRGQAVRVRYVPRDPWICRIEGGIGERLAVADLTAGENTLAGALWALIPGALIFSWARGKALRAQRAIEREEPGLSPALRLGG